MPGRRPKPTAIRKAEGNPGKRKLNSDEPQFGDADAINAPEGLDGVALDTWTRLAPQLSNAGVMKATDRDLLESYCRLYAHSKACWQAYSGEPVVEVNDKPVANPHAFEAIRAEKELSRLRTEIGLSPTARARLKVTEPPKGDDLDEFLKLTG